MRRVGISLVWDSNPLKLPDRFIELLATENKGPYLYPLVLLGEMPTHKKKLPMKYHFHDCTDVLVQKIHQPLLRSPINIKIQTFPCPNPLKQWRRTRETSLHRDHSQIIQFIWSFTQKSSGFGGESINTVIRPSLDGPLVGTPSGCWR